jgi:hypothetical protein
MFERLDTDNNGQISREEFAQARGGRGMRGTRGHGPGGPGPMAEGGPDGPPPPGGPRMRRMRHHGPGMGMGRGMGGRMGARMFGEAGFVTAEQFRARALERFDRADANHDGTLTVEERRARRGEMRRQHMGPPPPPTPEPAR